MNLRRNSSSSFEARTLVRTEDLTGLYASAIGAFVGVSLFMFRWWPFRCYEGGGPSLFRSGLTFESAAIPEIHQ